MLGTFSPHDIKAEIVEMDRRYLVCIKTDIRGQRDHNDVSLAHCTELVTTLKLV